MELQSHQRLQVSGGTAPPQADARSVCFQSALVMNKIIIPNFLYMALLLKNRLYSYPESNCCKFALKSLNITGLRSAEMFQCLFIHFSCFL